MDNPAPAVPSLEQIRARLLDPAISVDEKRSAVNDLMAHRNDPAAATLLDELVAVSARSGTLWLLARAYGYLGRTDKLPALFPLLEHPDHQVKVNAFKSVVMLDQKVAVERARKMIVEGSLELGIEVAAILCE